MFQRVSVSPSLEQQVVECLSPNVLVAPKCQSASSTVTFAMLTGTVKLHRHMQMPAQELAE